jgi:Putative Flp pilus-assembly TadE/G-like
MVLPRSHRGNAVTVGMMFTATLGFGALAVDLGVVRVGDAQLQHTLDSAVLSGVQRFDGTEEGIDSALATAQAIAQANPVFGQIVSLTGAGLVAGAWDPLTGSFSPWSAGGEVTPAAVNALVATLDGHPLPAALGGAAFGTSEYLVDGRAAAYRKLGAGPLAGAQCYLPLAVPECKVPGGTTNPPPTKFTFNPTPSDSVAWGLPNANPSSSALNAQLLDLCGSDPYGLGDMVFVNEGVHNSALKTLGNLLNVAPGDGTTTWNSELYGPLPARDGVTANLPKDSAVGVNRWGNTVEGVVPIVDGCADSFTGQLEIQGFAWAVVYDVRTRGDDKNLFMQLDVVHPHEVWGPTDPADDQVHDNVMGTGGPQFGGW